MVAKFLIMLLNPTPISAFPSASGLFFILLRVRNYKRERLMFRSSCDKNRETIQPLAT